VSRIVSNLREAVRGSVTNRMVLELGPVVERAARDAARSLGASDRLELDPGPSSIVVWAAPGPVELAVGNLVRNAIEASSVNGLVRVKVAVDGTVGVVTVEDSGPGVPRELMGKVFEPFVTTKTERGGTGLGLAITRDMIGRLGGEVVLENREEGGARATVRLELWKASEASS